MNLENGFQTISYETMENKDLSEVLLMEAASFSTPWSKAMFIEEMENPFAYSITVKQKETPKHLILGFFCFRNIRDESELFKICVHPQHRRLGIGKKMMRYYMEFCYSRDIKTFYLEVEAFNQAAIHLYQLFSYQPSGIRKKFYQNTCDALLMVKKG